MIGLALRGLTGGTGGLIGMILGPALVVLAVCGCMKCARFRMRDCSCIKHCLRVTGCDTFDDFEMWVHVHEVIYTTRASKLSTAVRLIAGDQQVTTDANTRGIFHKPLSIFITQGTEALVVELLDAHEMKVLATCKFDIVKDILEHANNLKDKVYPMKPKSKGVVNTKVKLTMVLDMDSEQEKGLLEGIAGEDDGISPETGFLLRQELNKAVAQPRDSTAELVADAPQSEIDLLARGCVGPLEMFGTWGRRNAVYAAVLGPPAERKYVLALWNDEHEFRKHQRSTKELELLRIESVMPDPNRDNVFIINYVDKDKRRQRFNFQHLDRNRDVWVEMLTLLIRKVRAEKDNNRQGARH